MGRWSYLDSDEERLPEGMTRTGYDADEGVYYFRDTDGSRWKGVPGRRYGPMHKIEEPPCSPQSSSSSSSLSMPPSPSSPSSPSLSSSPTIVEPYVAYYPRRPDPEFVKLWNNEGSNQAAGEDNGEPSKFGEAVQGVKAWATKQINPTSRKSPYRSQNPSEEKLVDPFSDEMSDNDTDIDVELEEKKKVPSDRERRRSRDRQQRPRQKSEPVRQGQTGTLLRVGQFIGDVLSFGSGPASKSSLNRAPTVSHKSGGMASIVRSSTKRRRNTML